MPISVTCPSCHKALSAPDSAAGKQALCPACRAVLAVPDMNQDSVMEAEAVESPPQGFAANPQGTFEPYRPTREPAAAGSYFGLAGQPAKVAADPSAGQRRACPICGELIMAVAAKCRYCQSILDPRLAQQSQATRSREDLRKIAARYNRLVVCIVGEAVAAVAAIVAGCSNLMTLLAVVLVAMGIAALAGFILVVMLSMSLYSVGRGICLGIVALIPYLGLVILLSANHDARRLLKENGIRVGLLWADMSQFRECPPSY